MKDIGLMLNKIMQEKQCSSVYALLLLHKEEGRIDDGIHKLQSESSKKASRRLRDKSSF